MRARGVMGQNAKNALARGSTFPVMLMSARLGWQLAILSTGALPAMVACCVMGYGVARLPNDQRGDTGGVSQVPCVISS